MSIDTALFYTVLPFNKLGVNHAYGEWSQEFFKETSIVSDSDTLSSLRVPIKVIWGDHDTIAAPSHFENIKKLAPESELFTITGVGHMPHLEDSLTFNSILLESLKEN